jgi:putative ABC transport system ATP-binding protein
MENVISTRGITKDYHVGDVVVHALRGIDLDVRRGEFLAIMGASGSGKSTLMNVLGCLDRPTAGEYSVGGTDVSRLTGDEYADIRNQRIGFVFQSYNLLPRTSALENVELPLFYDHTERIQDPEGSAVRALERVGLGGRLRHEPTQLSGGEQQRVAIARALVNRPSLILADEPTGNLDSRTSTDVMALFQDLNDQGITILLVTHEPDVAQYAKRIIVMRDGLIVSDRPVWDRRNAARDVTRMQPRDGAAVGGHEQSAAEGAVR